MPARASARLTDASVRNAKPNERPYKLSDGGGLFLAVQRTGAKCWRYRYRIGGRENLFAIGQYPELSLKEARAARDKARELVKNSVHPAAQRRAQKLVVAKQSTDTFEAVAEEWIAENGKSWSDYYRSQIRTVLTDDVYPDVGRLQIRDVRAAHLLAIVKRVERRGAPSIAVLIRQWCSAIFRYAVLNLRAEQDPASILKGVVAKPKVRHKHALLQSELPKFLAKLESSRSTEPVKIALQLLLLTFVRQIELREAPWSEFDLQRALWEIPAERMKMGIPHIVPLSRQAAALLQRLRDIRVTRGELRPLLFPNERDPRRPMSPITLNRCLERMGYGGYFSAHGFRATASTHLNSMGWMENAIERQLAHQEPNKTRASYNYAEYLAERTQMMQAWADYIDSMRSGENVVPIGHLRGGTANPVARGVAVLRPDTGSD